MEGVSDFIRDQLRTASALTQRMNEAEEQVKHAWRLKALAIVCIEVENVLCDDECVEMNLKRCRGILN